MTQFEEHSQQDPSFMVHITRLIENYETRLTDGNLHQISAYDFSSIIDHYYREFKLKEASQAAHLALKNHPNNTDLLLNVAAFYINLQRFEKAAPIIRKLLEIQPGHFEAQLHLANIYDGWGETDKALEFLEDVLKQYPENEENILTNRYNMLIRNQRCKEAIPIIKQLLLQNYDHPVASFELINCYDAIGKPEKAVEFYQGLVDKEPYNYKLWNNLGFLYTILNDDEKAIWAYEISLALNGNIAETNYCLGNIYSNNDDFSKSITYYHKAIEISGGDDLIFMELGFSYLHTEQFEKSIQYFKNSIAHYPEGHESWYGLGLAYDGLGQLRKASGYLKHAIKLFPQNGKYWFELGNILSSLSLPGAAVKAYRKAVKNFPSLTDAWIELIMLCFEANRKEQALYYTNKALKKNKGNDELLYIKAGIVIESGDIELGERILEKALEQNPYISYVLFEHFPKLNSNAMIKQIIQSYEN